MLAEEANVALKTKERNQLKTRDRWSYQEAPSGLILTARVTKSSSRRAYCKIICSLPRRAYAVNSYGCSKANS